MVYLPNDISYVESGSLLHHHDDPSCYNVGYVYVYMGLSENSVPLHPMVNDHYPY